VCFFVGVGEDAAVALVPEERVKGGAGDGWVPLSNDVAGFVGYEFPDVAPTSQRPSVWRSQFASTEESSL
jgi:hypothetical protein